MRSSPSRRYAFYSARYGTPSPLTFGSTSCVQAKLVKQEQQAIDAQFEKKRKNAEVAQKMYASQSYSD